MMMMMMMTMMLMMMIIIIIIIIMAISIALLGSNDLGSSMTPTFFFRNRFY